MKPETAFVIRRVLESFFNKICKTYNFSSDPDSYRELLQSYIREAFPGRDQEYYFDIYLDFLVNIVEPAKLLDQSSQWEEGPDEMAVTEAMRSKLKGEAPGVAETVSQDEPQKGDVPHLSLIHLALNQIEALGDCLVALGEGKEFEISEKTMVSIGTLIGKVCGITEALLNNYQFKEI
jgi:hypothetical protein